MKRSTQRIVALPISRMVAGVMLSLVSLFWGLAPSSLGRAMAFQTGLSELPISFPVQSPEIAAYFNQIARPQDIASLFPENINVLAPETAGQKMVAYRSWDVARSELMALAAQVDMVMYNPEHWELTPSDEQEDLASVVQEFAEFAHEQGMRFMFAPDRRFAELYLDEVGPYIDAVLLQGQRLQDDPQSFSSWVLRMTETARAVNPEMQIFVQVGATRGSASTMYAAIQTVANEIDGIAVWSMPRSLNVLREFVTLLRESPPAIQMTPSPTLIAAATTAAPTKVEAPAATPVPPTAAATVTIAAAATPARPTISHTPASAAVSATDRPATQTPSPTGVPASPAPLSQPEPGDRTGEWLERIGLVLGGMVIGFSLGYWIGSRHHGSRD